MDLTVSNNSTKAGSNWVKESKWLDIEAQDREALSLFGTEADLLEEKTENQIYMYEYQFPLNLMSNTREVIRWVIYMLGIF